MTTLVMLINEYGPIEQPTWSVMLSGVAHATRPTAQLSEASVAALSDTLPVTHNTRFFAGVASLSSSLR
jgi:hypothetical protein